VVQAHRKFNQACMIISAVLSSGGCHFKAPGWLVVASILTAPRLREWSSDGSFPPSLGLAWDAACTAQLATWVCRFRGVFDSHGIGSG
jgi:hypothetical protein